MKLEEKTNTNEFGTPPNNPFPTLIFLILVCAVLFMFNLKIIGFAFIAITLLAFIGSKDDFKKWKEYKKTDQYKEQKRLQDIKARQQLEAYTKSSPKYQTQQRIKENKENAVACCPKCGSTSIHVDKKGFGFGKAFIGSQVGLDVGMLAGGLGANKIKITCLNCGHSFKPGK